MCRGHCRSVCGGLRWFSPSARLDYLPGHSVAYYLGACTPQSHSALLGFFAQPLELAALGVREGGCVGEAQDDEVLVEGVLVSAVFVWVEIDVGEGAAVGVFGVSDARDLKAD